MDQAIRVRHDNAIGKYDFDLQVVDMGNVAVKLCGSAAIRRRIPGYSTCGINKDDPNVRRLNRRVRHVPLPLKANDIGGARRHDSQREAKRCGQTLSHGAVLTTGDPR